MKERPILFNTPMVQAILRGDKTMTRRAVKFPKDFTGENVFSNGSLGIKYTSDMGGDTVQRLSCPYGQVGERLWVRETWAKVSVPEGTTARKILTLFKASMPFSGIDGTEVRWKPSIYMPRYVSRITLEIVSIGVERLHDITEEDAKREGVRESNVEPVYPPDHSLCPDCGGELVRAAFGDDYGITEVDCTSCDTYKKRFEILWENINGPCSWTANPWVWVIEFKRI